MRLTDWRGNEYGVGDTVIYGRQSGRCVELQEGVVVDIWRVYQNNSYKWVRLEDNEEPPVGTNYAGEVIKNKITTRVKIQPSGNGSRNFGLPPSKCHYFLEDGTEVSSSEWFDLKYQNNPGAGPPRYTPNKDFKGYFSSEKLPHKAVTLTVIENITLVTPREVDHGLS